MVALSAMRNLDCQQAWHLAALPTSPLQDKSVTPELEPLQVGADFHLAPTSIFFPVQLQRPMCRAIAVEIDREKQRRQ
jgi:hypothetical protein